MPKQIREKVAKEKDWLFAVCGPGFHGAGKRVSPGAENLEPEGACGRLIIQPDQLLSGRMDPDNKIRDQNDGG
mgnify:CR=1 FL=1